MARLVDVRMDSAAVARLLESERGPVMRHVAEKAQDVKREARRQVGVSDPSARLSPRGQGQHLRDTIVTRFVKDSDGPAIWVGSDLPHARVHHEGSRPHVIEPVSAKALRFPSGGGGIVFAVRVQHPGTKPNRYLTDAARRVGLRVRKLN